MRAWVKALGGACLALLASGCDSGPHTLAWETSGSASEPRPLPWFGGPAYYGRWARGFPAEPSFFPLGVWMQNPSNAERFRNVGVNHYVGLWLGPTDEQLSAAVAAGMPVVCEQAGVWQAHLTNTTIQGWLQADSPDNAQEAADGSYTPCIEPSATQARYAEMVTADATRPVTLLLGQGVASPDWEGRGDCTGRISDYPGYAQAADILVNYTYPLNNGHPIELVGTGIAKLNEYAGFTKPVIASIEASGIDGGERPTPHQLRAEVWLSLIQGAAGIQYFCHRMLPAFNDTDCLDNAATSAAMTRINQELTQLAAVLNSQSFSMQPVSANASVPIQAVLKKRGNERYIFAAGAANGSTTARFTLSGVGEPTRIEVLGEGRDLVAVDGAFEDAFEAYAVHLYRLH